MLNRTFCSRQLFLVSVGLITGVLSLSSPALAGFQWVAPSPDSGAVQAQQAPVIIQAPTPAPALPSAPTPLTPAPSAPVMRAPQTLQLPQEEASPASNLALPEKAVQEGHMLVAPSSGSASLGEPAQEKEKIVRGFASNVPLAVALRQILPSEYGFSVGQDVQLSVLVSWQGGRPWRQTLEDMLHSVGLATREQGKMIHIVRVANAPAMAANVLASPSPAPALQPDIDNKPLSLMPPPGAAPTSHAPAIMVPETQARAVPSPQGASVDTWTASRGETLHKVLEKWSHRANVELSWEAEYDYPLQASVTLTGTFEEVVRTLLMGFQEAQPQPIASLHNSSVAGQTALVVQARGNNYND